MQPDGLKRRSFLALAPLGACKAAHAQTRTLEFWTLQLSPQLDDFVLPLLRDFENANPGVRIKWVDLPWAEAERKLLGAIAAGTPPDVVNLNPQFAARLAEFGALADPREHLSGTEIHDYLPAAWQANSLAGRCFGVPWYLSTNLTLYNRGVLRRAGVAAPATHAALLQAAPAIRRRGDCFAYFPALDGSTPLETLVAMGAPLLDSRGCAAGFIDARGAQVFDFYSALYTSGLTPRNVVSEGHRKAVEMFLSGQVAIISSGMQFLSYIRNSNPRIYADIDVAPQLRVAGQAPGIAAMNLVVPQGSKQRELAFRLARFVTAPAQQLAFARRVPILPSTPSALDDGLFAPQPDGDLMARARSLSVQHVRAGVVQVPPLRNYGKLRSSYAYNLQAVMLGRRSRDMGLDDVGQQWSRLLGCAA